MADVDVAKRVALVKATIAEACARVGRDPSEVTLVAVCKTHPPEAVVAAMRAGVTDFGENRVEEARGKIPAVEALAGSRPTWHMVGHIQRRKARDVVALFDFVHSVDRLKLAERLSRLASEAGREIPILLEINVSGEETKWGWRADHWKNTPSQRNTLWSDVEAILKLPGLRVEGLMTMAPIVDDPETARPIFVRLRELRDALATDFPEASWRHLSMGMTDDYPVAVEEGATIVRIGRAIFGPRRSE